MINDEVPLETVQRMLDHASPEMTARYATIKDQTLRREWERFTQRVNVRGELIPLEPAGSAMSDAAWALENLSRAKQTLPNGYCGLPVSTTTSARSRPYSAIPDAERVHGLVNQQPQPRVGRLLLVDDDPPGLLIAPTARLSRGRLERDCEPERLGERLHRSEQMSMGVAGQRLTGWFQGRGLDTLQRRDLGAIEHRDGFEQQPRLGVLV